LRFPSKYRLPRSLHAGPDLWESGARSGVSGNRRRAG